MLSKENIMHVVSSNEKISQRYRYLTPIVNTDDDIKDLLARKRIDDCQAKLLWLIDVQKNSFTSVAKSLNCSRQNVHHKYNSIRKHLGNKSK